jgi:quinol monooxygenase YgiN
MKFIAKTIVSLFLIVSTSLFAEAKKDVTENMKFGMQVVMTAQAGKGEELAQIMLNASNAVSTLKGCEIYIVQVAANDSDKILIAEVWASQKDQQASLANQEVRDLISQARPLIAVREHIPAKPLGGKGL